MEMSKPTLFSLGLPSVRKGVENKSQRLLSNWNLGKPSNKQNDCDCSHNGTLFEKGHHTTCIALMFLDKQKYMQHYPDGGEFLNIYLFFLL